ncbi:MAG: 4-hydroxy-tetrahydrodipicolinate reductase [Clostridiales bacterium]|jgi:4-hydroxy-tetrahydrodipicolinate reductase|nr:4-hydroxy-tetrahydrodipicolinate reductase [Clostridiales bacterium]MDR2712433.1 4-hydroxy-tetrahydrodipicolinate reductase [Clostridiales bacterium]
MVRQIKILVNGAAGKMGRAMINGILPEADLQIVAAVDLKQTGADIGVLSCDYPWEIRIETDLLGALIRTQPDVMLDFTNAQAALRNVRTALEHKVATVVGTTGLESQDLEKLGALAKERQTPVFVAPNFSLGAVLMMSFAAQAALHFPHAEVIERHHDQKLDAPSGTAIATMEGIAKQRAAFAQGDLHEFEKIPGSRGGDYQGMRVHSIRLPGYVASQEVVFGGLGQIFTIKHEALSREAYLPGVLLALRKINCLQGLVCGLEALL